MCHASSQSCCSAQQHDCCCVRSVRHAVWARQSKAPCCPRLCHRDLSHQRHTQVRSQPKSDTAKRVVLASHWHIVWLFISCPFDLDSVTQCALMQTSLLGHSAWPVERLNCCVRSPRPTCCSQKESLYSQVRPKRNPQGSVQTYISAAAASASAGPSAQIQPDVVDSSSLSTTWSSQTVDDDWTYESTTVGLSSSRPLKINLDLKLVRLCEGRCTPHTSIRQTAITCLQQTHTNTYHPSTRNIKIAVTQLCAKSQAEMLQLL